MDENVFPAMYGDRVTVKIPKGLPGLMMNVTREVLRNPPEQECEAYSLAAEYLERLLKDKLGEDDVTTMVTNLRMTDEERYMDKLKKSGYTVEQLDELASTIQQGWKRYLSRTPERRVPAAKIGDNVWTHEMVTDDLIKMVESYGLSLESANKAASLIQKTWRKYSKVSSISITKSSTSAIRDIVIPPKQSKTSSLDEFDFENDSDDMERVNVVKKGQRDYVPPIPDFIDDDTGSLKDPSTMNTIDRLRETSYVYNDEAADEDSIN